MADCVVANSTAGLQGDTLATAEVTLTTDQVVVGAGGSAVKVLASPADAAKFLNGADPPAWAIPAGSAGSFTSSIYVHLREEQAQNTAGGTFTSGAWRTRVLNTEVADVGGLCSLASNQITLTAGTYLIRANAPAYSVNRHQLRLQNVTDATTVLVGGANYAPSGSTSSRVTLEGMFIIAGSKALELQHQCQTTHATDGLGPEGNFTTEIYAVVELWKIG